MQMRGGVRRGTDRGRTNRIAVIEAVDEERRVEEM